MTDPIMSRRALHNILIAHDDRDPWVGEVMAHDEALRAERDAALDAAEIHRALTADWRNRHKGAEARVATLEAALRELDVTLTDYFGAPGSRPVFRVDPAWITARAALGDQAAPTYEVFTAGDGDPGIRVVAPPCDIDAALGEPKEAE